MSTIPLKCELRGKYNSEEISELLRIAKVSPENLWARQDLVTECEAAKAWFLKTREPEAPPRLLRKINSGAQKLLAAINELNNYRGFEHWPYNDCNIECLTELRRSVKEDAPLVRKGRRPPGKLDKLLAVQGAANVFIKHSPLTPSTDPDNKFAEFAERFYELAFKSKPWALDWHIRKVLKKRDTWRVQKVSNPSNRSPSARDLVDSLGERIAEIHSRLHDPRGRYVTRQNLDVLKSAFGKFTTLMSVLKSQANDRAVGKSHKIG
jgi:hypothetical protein